MSQITIKKFFDRLRLVKIPIWVKILVSVVLLGLVFNQIDWSEVKLALQLLPPWLLFLMTTSGLFLLLVNSIRWAVLIPLPLTRPILHRLTAASYLSAFYTLFLPSALGGDVIKWGLSFGTQAPKSRLASSIVMDRIIGLVAASALSLGALLYLESGSTFGQVALFPGHNFNVVGTTVPIEIARAVQILSAGVMMIVILWLIAIRFPKMISSLPLPKKLIDLLLLFQASPRVLVTTASISLVNQLLAIGLSYLAFTAVGTGLSFPELIMITSLTAIVASLPISFGGFGTTELSLVYLTNLLGANQPAVLAIIAIGIPLRLINTAIVGLAGWGLQHRLPR